MTEQIYNNPDIFKIYIPLPDNPLKNLNCYVLKTPNENLIIDTGFNREECLSAFMEGLEEIGVDLKNSSFFNTPSFRPYRAYRFCCSSGKKNIYG